MRPACLPLALLGLLAFTRPADAAEQRVLSLEEALELAQTHQPQMRAARAQLDSSAARVGQARSGYLPRLDAQAQYQRTTANFVLSPSIVNAPFASGIRIVNRLGMDDTVGYTVFGATATETLYDFGRTGGTLNQAKEAKEASRATMERTWQDTALLVRTSYFQVLAAKELLWVREQAVANQKTHVRAAEHFFAAGSRPKIDLRSAELNLASAELALVRARNALAQAKLDLNAAIGLEQAPPYDVVVPPVVPLPEEDALSEQMVSEVLRHRPDLISLEAQIRSQRGARTAAVGNYLPALGVAANLSGSKVENFDTGLNWYVGAGLNWNLFSGLAHKWQLAEADARIAVAEAQRDALRQAARNQIELQHLAVLEARERLELSERAVQTAKERLQLAEGRYQAGAGDIIELDDAQVTQDQAQADRVSALYDLALARARLTNALGKK